jgi:hypothetical protein
MKTRLLLFAFSLLIFAGCHSGDSDAAVAKQKADSLAAIAHMDSLLNASKAMRSQDSTDAAKKDTTKKADTAKGQK